MNCTLQMSENYISLEKTQNKIKSNQMHIEKQNKISVQSLYIYNEVKHEILHFKLSKSNQVCHKAINRQ